MAQLEQMARSVRTIRSWGFEDQAVVELWVNELWKVEVVE